MFKLIVVVCVRLPDVPVIVSGKVPRAAVVLTRSVSVLEVVAGLGLNVAVTPEGRPEALSVTLPLNPFDGVILIVLCVLRPRLTLKLLGDAESEKLGAGVTVTEIVVVWVKLGVVPVTVIVNVPVEAELLAESVSVLVVVVGSGMKEAVTPLGKPEADKLTLSVAGTVLVQAREAVRAIYAKSYERSRLHSEVCTSRHLSGLPTYQELCGAIREIVRRLGYPIVFQGIWLRYVAAH